MKSHESLQLHSGHKASVQAIENLRASTVYAYTGLSAAVYALQKQNTIVLPLADWQSHTTPADPLWSHSSPMSSRSSLSIAKRITDHPKSSYNLSETFTSDTEDKTRTCSCDTDPQQDPCSPALRQVCATNSYLQCADHMAIEGFFSASIFESNMSAGGRPSAAPCSAI